MMRIPLLKGRYLSNEDIETSPRVVVINQAAARKYFPDVDAVGQRLTVNEREVTVVGVVGDIRHIEARMMGRLSVKCS